MFIDLVDLWVHMDIHGPILQKLLSPFLQTLFYPISELFTSNIEYDVGNVLSMKHVDLSLFLWQYLKYFRIVGGKLQHLINRKAVKMWNMYLAYIFTFDGLSLSLND